MVGVSRSVTIVIAYLLKKYKYNLSQVISMLQRKRKKVNLLSYRSIPTKDFSDNSKNTQNNRESNVTSTSTHSHHSGTKDTKIKNIVQSTNTTAHTQRRDAIQPRRKYNNIKNNPKKTIKINHIIIIFPHRRYNKKIMK
jgi:hypothetical protein